MINLLIIIFTMTLTYLVVAGRLDTYIRILALQGFLLFGISFLGLHEIDLLNLVFILVETLVFKAIIVPYYTQKSIDRSGVRHEIEPDVPNFYSVLIVMTFIMGSFAVAYQLHDQHLQITYFTASLSTMLTGLYLIFTRKTIITHVVGYLVLENGIFLLSLAFGGEMPTLINIAILLDIFSSLLILLMIINRIGDVFKTVQVDSLSDLQD
ncbi:MAG: hypothetical protein U0Y10_18470 [Spirosomataceae bacterium]